MDLISTLKGSMMEGYFPAGWDLAKIDRLAAAPPAALAQRQPWWNAQFEPVACASFEDFDTFMGHEIAREIFLARQANRPIAFILPVGPMGMYRWTVFFLTEWGVPCDHVHGFNMDEWSDAQGNTLPPENSGAFQYAMQEAFYGPLGKLTVPTKQRHFAWKNELPTYAEQIGALKKKGGRLVTVFGIGRVCHIAFWEPHFAAEFADEAAWEKQTHRLGAKLHPLTVEQNALTSFQSRTTLFWQARTHNSACSSSMMSSPCGLSDLASRRGVDSGSGCTRRACHSSRPADTPSACCTAGPSPLTAPSGRSGSSPRSSES